MKVRLLDALHARPANLLVRVASRHSARVELWKGTCRADARKILDVLSLGAARGDEVELRAFGDGAEVAIAELAALIDRNFDADLVPETGSAAVEGVAIGHALVVAAPSGERRAKGSSEDEGTRLVAAITRVVADVEGLIAALAPSEASLFEPEREILRELEGTILARVALGASAEEAVLAATMPATTDLLLDARARLLDALGGERNLALDRALAEGGDREIVLIAEMLTPSLVASLPARVRGIIAAYEEGEGPASHAAPGAHTSHAAILARGRDLPLAFVPSHVAQAIAHGEHVVIDTTASPARVWVAPSEARIREARLRIEELAQSRAREESEVQVDDLATSMGVELHVNIGSLQERIPRGAKGVGLLRTELVFAGRAGAPGEGEQLAAMLAVARAAHDRVVTVRLFDAGGDKPLPWLAVPEGAGDLRGIALLLRYPAVLDAQLRALVRAAAHSKVRALVPMTRSAADVDEVRRRAPGLAIGAMIETPEAVRDIEAIAAASDFVCVGTNDLTAFTLGVSRAGGGGSAAAAGEGPLDPRVVAHLAAIVRGAHAHGRKVTVCGEVAADKRGACILVGLGVDALSVAPARFGEVAQALRATTLDDCKSAARAAGSEVEGR